MIKIINPKFNLNSAIDYLKKERIYDTILKITLDKSNRMKPDYIDLARIHKLIRKNKIFTSLEFGIGFSTLIIADALQKNKKEFEESKFKDVINKNNKFENHSVDSSKKWLQNFRNDFKNTSLYKNINLNYSSIYLEKFNNQFCTFYQKIPSVLPDFIYLDGPDPSNIKNKYENIDYTNNDFVVMSGDILRFENFLLPGCIILIDGRNTNSRFIRNNLIRNWVFYENYKASYSLFYLNEDPIGVKNQRYLQYKFK